MMLRGKRTPDEVGDPIETSLDNAVLGKLTIKVT